MRGHLSERDWAILATVAAHRFVTTAQLEAFHFAGHASQMSGARVCRRVLERLRRERVLGTLERRVGGIRAGSASYVWHVDAVGDRLLRDAEPRRTRRRRYEPSLHFLRHTLAVVDTHLSLLRLSRDGRVELIQVDAEPACHRRYPGLGGGTITLKSDLFAVTVSGEFEDSWFIEVDLATESLPRLVAKCQEYEAYRRSGVEEAARGVFPIVVWTIETERRREALLAAIATDANLRSDLYRVIAPDQLGALVSGGAS
ncbi:replication-relaxation family protein [Rhodococcus spelaei]|uniref:replication-relaxation family protein n=1 Tax=Rhodococcus spelaei TaxID=2546320 RepID=UPI0015EF1CAB|nr:replication-relaxation family protein [Rhodococcus spelaei]